MAELFRKDEGGVGKEEGQRFILNKRPRSAGVHCHSPTWIKLIGCNWFGTHFADIYKKVSGLLFELVEVELWGRTRLLLLIVLWDFSCIEDNHVSHRSEEAVLLQTKCLMCYQWGDRHTKAYLHLATVYLCWFVVFVVFSAVPTVGMKVTGCIFMCIKINWITLFISVSHGCTEGMLYDGNISVVSNRVKTVSCR